MQNLTREEISEFINNEFGLSRKDCSDLVNFLLEDIIVGLISNNIVKIHNFGTFKVKKKKERIGRNPKTKENFMISSRNVVTFSISKNILDTINTKADGKKI